MVVASPITGAAIIGGELIISLPNGQIINCGLVQGPPGLKGEPGAPGPTGKAGLDGNTLLHGQGFPALDIGRDGDFYWMTGPDLAVFGPKISGQWGTPVYLKQPIVGVNADAVPMAMGGVEGGGSGDGPSKVYTNQVIAAGTGRSGRLKETKAGVSYAGSPNGIISPSAELKVQSNINNWIVSCIERFDAVVPVGMGGILPGSGDYDGDLFYAGDSLFIWSAEHGWQPISAGDSGPPVYVGEDEPPNTPQEGELWYSTKETDLTLFIYTGTTWAPAAPPVSLDGIEAAVEGVDAAANEALQKVGFVQMQLDQDREFVKRDQERQDNQIIEFEKSQERQDNQIIELEEEIESLAPSFDRGEWLFVTEEPAAGQYAIGHLATSEYCLDIVGKCLIEAGDDEVAKSQCTRIAADCEAAEEKGEAYLSDSWGAVDTLKIHKLDAKGKEHGFGDWSVGKYVELFNHDDEGYGLFQIDKEAVIEADVATFKVHHVAHQGKPAGVARAKVFEMAAGDPTDYVRKSGDDMTGALYIRPPKNSTGLRIYAPQGDAGAGQADATQLVRVANSHNQYVFYVEESGAIAGKDGMLPTQNRHLVSKKYVDELIAAELTAPARFEWKVYVNADGTPQQGSANLNGASMSDTSVIRLHKRAQNAPVPIKGHGSGLTMYKYSPSPKFYHSTILSAWSNTGTEWQWKGTAEIDQIKLFSDYIQITLSSHKWSNMNFSNTGSYRFTIGGLF